MNIRDYLARTEEYLSRRLLPFWIERILEPEHGGFCTSYDRDGLPTAEAPKTLLCQARSIYALSMAARRGHHTQALTDIVFRGREFLARFRDEEHGGYVWIVEPDGAWVDDSKVAYGISFLIYGLSELAELTGDAAAMRDAVELFALLADRGADFRSGGFYEHFDRGFNVVSVRGDGMFHKSLDVHMHLMEAFTNLAVLTGDHRHRRAAVEVSELIFDRMIDPSTGCGIALFTPQWTPVANAQLGTVWGSDRFDEDGKAPEITSYGHNIELAWLYLHTCRALGIGEELAISRVEPLFRHTLHHGMDWEYGGIYVEGDRRGGVTDTDKEFWQQAEALVGFLDAYLLLGDEEYLHAFRKTYDFVFDHLVHPQLGEWHALASRDGTLKRDYLGHDWKICYHTVRAVCLVVEKLKMVG